MTAPRPLPPGHDAGAVTSRDRSTPSSLSVLVPSRWDLWTLRPRALAYVLVVDALALATIVAGFLWRPSTGHDWVVGGLLFLGAAVHAEAARHIERIRISRTDRPFIDLKSMWTFAGMLLMHLGPGAGAGHRDVRLLVDPQRAAPAAAPLDFFRGRRSSSAPARPRWSCS